MKRILEYRGSLFLASIVLYLIGQVAPYPWLHHLISIGSLVSLLVGFIPASRSAKILSSVFILLGIGLSISSRLSLLGTVYSFGSMLNLLTLFSIVPIIAIPVKIGKYDTAIESVLTERTSGLRMLYFKLCGTSYLLAVLMNVATIPMMYHSVKKAVERRIAGPIPIEERIVERVQGERVDSDQFLLKSIISGYAMPLTWSPVAAVVAAVVTTTHVNWFAVVPVTISISIIGLLMSVALLRVPAESSPDAPSYSGVDSYSTQNAALDNPTLSRRDDSPSGPARGIWQIIVGVVVFVVSMLVLQTLTGWSMIDVISVVSIPFAWIWSLLVKENSAFLANLKAHQKTVKNLHNTYTVFTAAGFFVEVLQASPYHNVLDTGFVFLSQHLGPAVFVALIPVIMLALSMIGFHPIVSIALLAAALHPSVLHISITWLSVALFSGGVLTFIVSPFNATLNITSAVSGHAPGKLMLWNLKFSMVFLAFVMLVTGVGQQLFP